MSRLRVVDEKEMNEHYGCNDPDCLICQLVNSVAFFAIVPKPDFGRDAEVQELERLYQLEEKSD